MLENKHSHSKSEKQETNEELGSQNKIETQQNNTKSCSSMAGVWYFWWSYLGSNSLRPHHPPNSAAYNTHVPTSGGLHSICILTSWNTDSCLQDPVAAVPVQRARVFFTNAFKWHTFFSTNHLLLWLETQLHYYLYQITMFLIFLVVVLSHSRHKQAQCTVTNSTVSCYPVLNFFCYICPLFLNLLLLKFSGHGQNKAESFVRIYPDWHYPSSAVVLIFIFNLFVIPG